MSPVILKLMTIFFISSTHALDPLVTIDCGKLEGKLIRTSNGDCLAFLGVPFAAPPIGQLRWKV